MTLLVIADDLSVAYKPPSVMADVLISCGDLPEDAILRVAEHCRCQHIVAVKGNHDTSGGFVAPIIDLHLRVHSLGALSFAGFGGSWKYKPRGHHLFEQWEVESAMAHCPPADIFVAHNSPRFIHERDKDVHVGFDAFGHYIERARPRFFLHGHQHVQVETQLGTTMVMGTYGYRVLCVPESSP